MASRKQYLQTLMGRYLKARKRQKGPILDEFCRNTGQNRKYIIRKISRLASTEPGSPRKRSPRYGPETARALETLWKIFDYPCGQRLRAAAVAYLKRWYFWATHSRLEQVIYAARTIKRYWKGIVGFLGARVTNGMVEGLNSKIKTAIKRAYGIKHVAYLRTIIYLVAGRLSFSYPY